MRTTPMQNTHAQNMSTTIGIDSPVSSKGYTKSKGSFSSFKNCGRICKRF